MSKAFYSNAVFFPVFTLSFLLANRQSDYFIVGSFVVLAYCWILNSLKRYRQGEAGSLNPLSALLFLWLSWNSLLLFAGWVNSTALFGMMQCSMWIVVYCFVVRQEDEFWGLSKTLLFSLAFISALLALYQHYYLHEMAVGLFAARNSNGVFCALVLMLLCGDLVFYKKGCSGYFKCVLFFILNTALLLSFSRGVLLAYGLGLLFFSVCNWRYLNKQQVYQFLFLSFIALLCFFLSSYQGLAHRLHMLAQEKSRVVIWQGTWDLWRATSWYGIGLFNFKYYYKAFSLPDDNSSLDYAHNDYLQLLVETGIPGVLILSLIGFYLLFLGKRYFRKPKIDPKAHLAITSLFASLLVFLAHSVVDYNFYLLPLNLVLGLILALLIRKLGSDYVPAYRIKKLALCLAPIFLLMISLLAYRLVAFSYYAEQAELAKNKQDYDLAIAANIKALSWLNHPEAHSMQADLYIEKAKEQARYLSLAKQELQAALKQNKYYARAYFQLGLIDLLFYDEEEKAERLFTKALSLDRHDSVLRFFYSQFLIQVNRPQQAKKLLSEGLYYPLAPEIESPYLVLLAKL